jgi:dienelactone hydrolase
VYPFTSPNAPKDAEVRVAGSFGRGERGASRYEDHGGSELSYEGEQLLGALEEGGSNLAAHAGTGTQEIAAEEWISFFDSFSRQHEGWLVSIMTIRGGEQKTEVRDVRLEGISSDHLNAWDEIYISVDRGNRDHLTHAVKSPLKVMFRQDLRDAHEGIDVHSADGTVTGIRFRIAARPESLDGVLVDTDLSAGQSRSEPGTTSRGGSQSQAQNQEMEFHIPVDRTMLEGNLTVPKDARGVVVFAHGSGSSRHSPRNRYVASVLHHEGFATLLMDLLTREEEALDDRTRAFRFDIDLLARRLIAATWWLKDQSATASLPIGYFGASTGAAAALVAAADVPDLVSAVVSRGGRPDLAGNALHKVIVPTLLIVGGKDTQVIELNRKALELIPAQKELVIVPGATHLFEEPGTLEKIADLAKNWFVTYVAKPSERTEAA